MNGRGLPPGARDLSAPRIAITRWEVWPSVVVEVTTGQVGRFGGEYSLSVMNVPAGSGHIIPYDAQNLTKLRDNINAVLEGNKDEQAVN